MRQWSVSRYLQMGDFLLVTIQVDMHDQLALRLQDDLVRSHQHTCARGVLIDISALDMVDSFIGRMIATISGLSRIMDAETVLVGMQPAVAITLVELGLTLPGVSTALNVDRGMKLLRERVGRPMTVRSSGSQPIRIEQDVVLARQTARKLASECGMRLIDLTKLVTAVSELARNTMVYGGGGDMDWQILEEAGAYRSASGLPRRRPGHSRHQTGDDRRLDLRRRPGPGPDRCETAGGRVRTGHRARRGTRVTITRWT